MLRETLRASSAVIYNSGWGMHEIHSVIDPDCEETVIHNGTTFDPSLVASPGDGRVVALTCCDTYSTPTKRRALDSAVRAVSSLSGVDLWVVGDDPRNGSGASRYYGHVSDDGELRRIRSAAGVVIHLVERDYCPNTIVESRAAGIPVVCHSNSGVPEIMGPGGVAVEDLDPERLSMAVRGCLDSPVTLRERIDDFEATLEIGVVAEAYEGFIGGLL
jgi:glycosyltransferase involved in cell wall biosynthesis